MRRFLPATLTAGLLLLVPVATAQEDGCVQSNPCLLDVEVDEAGIASISVTNLTTGDWFFLSVSNLDDRTHTVSLAGASVQVEGYGLADSAAFQAPAPGTYPLSDQPTGDSADIHVLAGDVVAAEDQAAQGSSDKGNGIPAPSVAWTAALLAACVFFGLRRRV